jgi:hypothetical protein
LAFILTFAGIALLLTAFGIFIGLQIGSGWEIPSSLRLPIALSLAVAGIFCIFADLRHWWRAKNYLALAAYPILGLLVILVVVRQI